MPTSEDDDTRVCEYVNSGNDSDEIGLQLKGFFSSQFTLIMA